MTASPLPKIRLSTLQALNRLRVHPLDEPIPTTRRLADAPPPAATTADEAVAGAEQRSPDLALARRTVQAAAVRVEAARQERRRSRASRPHARWWRCARASARRPW